MQLGQIIQRSGLFRQSDHQQQAYREKGYARGLGVGAMNGCVSHRFPFFVTIVPSLGRKEHESGEWRELFPSDFSTRYASHPPKSRGIWRSDGRPGDCAFRLQGIPFNRLSVFAFRRRRPSR
jgi:hypothetical protein